MVEIKKKPKETTSSVLRRFTQKVRESRILINAKKSMFRESKRSRRMRRVGALERERRRKARQKLKKMGKL